MYVPNAHSKITGCTYYTVFTTFRNIGNQNSKKHKMINQKL